MMKLTKENIRKVIEQAKREREIDIKRRNMVVKAKKEKLFNLHMDGPCAIIVGGKTKFTRVLHQVNGKDVHCRFKIWPSLNEINQLFTWCIGGEEIVLRSINRKMNFPVNKAFINNSSHISFKNQLIKDTKEYVDVYVFVYDKKIYKISTRDLLNILDYGIVIGDEWNKTVAVSVEKFQKFLY